MNPLVLIFGAAVAASYFLPWVDEPPLPELSPNDLLGIPTLEFLQQADVLTLVFLATFALGALVAVLSLFGITARLLTFLAGALPFGLAVYVYLNAADRITALGLPAPTSRDISEIWEVVRTLAGMGLYAWLGGAAGLLIAFLFSPSRRP